MTPADGGRLRIVDDGVSPAGAAGAVRSSYSLRVSVLDACNLACGYCAPGTLAPPMASSRRLTAPEHARLAAQFASLPDGARLAMVRFTGGEPLLRPDLVDVVAAWRAGVPGARLALTTNATRLAAQAAALRAAGIESVTVHLDTLREARVTSLMGPGASVASALAALEVAQATFSSVKLNVVVQRGRNDDELVDFVRWSRGSGVQVRFIELMRTGSADAVVDDTFFAGREVVAALGARPLPRAQASDPAALFSSADGVVFGVIASDTEPFCSACDRLRLTADGRLRGCLYEAGGVPLGDALRRGADDAELRALLGVGVRGKRSFHPLATTGARAPFSMADVGG